MRVEISQAWEAMFPFLSSAGSGVQILTSVAFEAIPDKFETVLCLESTLPPVAAVSGSRGQTAFASVKVVIVVHVWTLMFMITKGWVFLRSWTSGVTCVVVVSRVAHFLCTVMSGPSQQDRSILWRVFRIRARIGLLSSWFTSAAYTS